MVRFQIGRLVLLVAVTLTTGHAEAEPLLLGYVQRPGLADMIDGKPSGAFLPLAAAAAQYAHVDIQWQMLPQKRLIDEVRVNRPNYCACGIYKTAERLTFAKFTLPFYRDKPFVIIALKRNEATIRSHKTFAELIADTTLKVGLIQGYSYGRILDGMLAKTTVNADRMVGATTQHSAKLVAGRIDYVIGVAEEANNIEASGKSNADDFVRVEFPDMPLGELRHFMCSMAVDDTLIARLNEGINALHLKLGAPKP